MRRLLSSICGAVALLGVMATSANAQTPPPGRAVFQANCASCHQAVANGHTLIGPNLWGVVGRPAGSVAGFAYSPAMRNSHITWTPARLTAYITAPAATVPGNRMPYAGLHNPAQVTQLVAYLQTLH